MREDLEAEAMSYEDYKVKISPVFYTPQEFRRQQLWEYAQAHD